MLVSFIIPAYNAADTIVRCLDSIRNLTLSKENYEILVIDDASTDDTVSVIGNWKLDHEDCKLEILRQTLNQRQGAARNRGVKEAKGEYICFVDADDVVTEGIVEAIRLAKEKQIDMVAFHCASANEQGEIIREKEYLSFEEGETFTGIDLQNRYPYWFSGPVAYIYNRAFLEEVNYPFVEGVLFEDSDFVAVHLYHAKRMTYSPELGYKAYEREGSTTRHTSYKSVADYLLLGVRMMRFYERIKVESGKRKEEGVEQFAEGILEGACYNVSKSCKWLIKLSDLKEVGAFYERVDMNVNRKELCICKPLRKYYWNPWTLVCLKQQRLATVLLSVLMPMYRMGRKWEVERGK